MNRSTNISCMLRMWISDFTTASPQRTNMPPRRSRAPSATIRVTVCLSDAVTGGDPAECRHDRRTVSGNGPPVSGTLHPPSACTGDRAFRNTGTPAPALDHQTEKDAPRMEKTGLLRHGNDPVHRPARPPRDLCRSRIAVESGGTIYIWVPDSTVERKSTAY